MAVASGMLLSSARLNRHRRSATQTAMAAAVYNIKRCSGPLLSSVRLNRQIAFRDNGTKSTGDHCSIYLDMSKKGVVNTDFTSMM